MSKTEASGAEPDYLVRLPQNAQYLGRAADGEIEIVADEPRKQRIRRERGAMNRGTALGVVYEDEYILVIRDPVQFPSGKLGTYVRILWQNAPDGVGGVVVLGHVQGRLLLRRMFRHATRRWELEAPRGGSESQTPDRAVLKESAEEVGLPVLAVERLGEIAVDSGLLGSTAIVYWVEFAEGPLEDAPEATEAMGALVEIPCDQLREVVRRGEVRDSFTLAAITLAACHGKLTI